MQPNQTYSNLIMQPNLTIYVKLTQLNQIYPNLTFEVYPVI